MNSENKNNLAQKKIHLSLSLAAINKVLMALGHLPFNQVHDVIEDIRVQTEVMLTANGSPVAKDIKNYEQHNTNS